MLSFGSVLPSAVHLSLCCLYEWCFDFSPAVAANKVGLLAACWSALVAFTSNTVNTLHLHALAYGYRLYIMCM
jgi:hypothetical protein